MIADAAFDPIVVDPALTPERIRELISRGGESWKLDYKLRYDPQLPRDVVEFTKDIIAMANTAGGYLVIGVADDNTPKGLTAEELKRIDEATIRAQVQSYLGTSIDIFINKQVELNEKQFAIITILQSRRSPLVFEKQGEYKEGQNPNSKLVFRAGDVFVRHGSSSERWNQEDVREMYARIVDREKQRWIADILPDIKQTLVAVSGESADQVPPSNLLHADPTTFEQEIRRMLRRKI